MLNAFVQFKRLVFSVFNVPVELVARCVNTRWNEQYEEEPVQTQKHYILSRVDFDLSYAYLESPSFPIRHRWDPAQLLFWEPLSLPGRTVMMTNSSCGNSHAVFRMSEEVPWECIYVMLPRPDCPEVWNTVMFNYYRDHRRIARNLGVGQEENGRWVWCVDGPVQPFENTDFYKRRRIRDRLNREVVTEYLLRLGYDITQDNFWLASDKAWLLWDNWYGRRSAPGRDGVDIEGTRTGWHP